MSRYRFIAAERGHYPIRRLCQVLGVPASRYYAWQTGQQRAVDQQTPAWETALVKTFGIHQRRYGTRRLQVALRENGHRVGRQRLLHAQALADRDPMSRHRFINAERGHCPVRRLCQVLGVLASGY